MREGGVIRAAVRLNRVQSNVTTRIKQLEERLGVALFSRHGRSLALTSSGQALLVHSERLLRMAADVEAEIRSGPVCGPLRLGSMESTAGSRLPKVLTSFHQRRPNIDITLQTGTTAAMIRKIIDYELDAAFVGEPFSAVGLQSRPIFEEELVLITSKSHPLVRNVSDLQCGTILAFAQGCSYRQRLEEWFALDGTRPMRVMELASYQAIIACASAGTGCAIVPVSLLDALRASKDIKRHSLSAKLSRNRTHLIWKGAPSAALQEFLDTI